MSTFNDRQAGFENKFKHDQELQFKATARRNKLVGLWAAAKFGLSGDAADAYAKDVVAADFDKHGVKFAAADVQAQLAHFMPIAKQQLMEQL
jgi:hypothetical protein